MWFAWVVFGFFILGAIGSYNKSATALHPKDRADGNLELLLAIFMAIGVAVFLL